MDCSDSVHLCFYFKRAHYTFILTLCHKTHARILLYIYTSFSITLYILSFIICTWDLHCATVLYYSSLYHGQSIYNYNTIYNFTLIHFRYINTQHVCVTTTVFFFLIGVVGHICVWKLNTVYTVLILLPELFFRHPILVVLCHV